MTTAALAVKRANAPMGERGLIFDLESAIRFADGLVKSGMAPKGITGPGAVVALIEAGNELGLAPMYALANLTFTNGRLGIMGDAAKALIKNAKVLKPGTDFEAEYSGEPFTESWTCKVTAHREGFEKPFSESFSIADAIAAKLVRLDKGVIKSRGRGGTWNEDGPWSTYPKRLLMYRPLGFLCRDRFSDVLGGAVLVEELRDYPQEERHTVAAAPAEPDPLLEGDAVVAVGSEAVEAEIVAETNEHDFIAAVERLEGDIETVWALSELAQLWENAAPLLARLSESERQRITKLYTQRVANFGTQEKTNAE